MAAEIYAESQDRISGQTNPGMKFTAITPHDTNELVYVTRGIMVTVSGNVKVMGVKDTVACVLPLAAGVIHPIMAKRIYATDTTATGIVAVN